MLNLIMRNNIEKAKKHLQKARALIAKSGSPLNKMTEAQVIAKIRKDRERIWEEKFVTHS